MSRRSWLHQSYRKRIKRGSRLASNNRPIMKTNIEDHFHGLWNRANAPNAGPLSAEAVKSWAEARGLTVSSSQERQVGIFRLIPAVVLDLAGTKGCFPMVSMNCPEWKANRAAADAQADLWKKVEWFGPLWISNGSIKKLLADIQHCSAKQAIQYFDYHMSTAYTLPFQAVCIAQLLPETRSMADFAPLAREAYLAFYSGHRASSVAALIPVIEGGVQRIVGSQPSLKVGDAIDRVIDRAIGLAADLHFDGMWVPDQYRTVDYLFGQDERVFVFETFRRWLKECFFQDCDKYSGVTWLNRHLFAHGLSTEWQLSSNFSRLVVAITTLGVIEAWHDETNVVPILFPAMDDGAKLLWQQALHRAQIQIALNLQEQREFQTKGRLVPELPTDNGVMLRKAVLAEDAIKDLVRPLRNAGWNVHITEPDEEALYVIATATSGDNRIVAALLFSCATANELYRELAETVDLILYRGSPYKQSAYATGIPVHVGPVAGWCPPQAPKADLGDSARCL